MHYIIWCEGPFHICSSGPWHLRHQTQVETGHTTTSQYLHVNTAHHNTGWSSASKTPISSSKVKYYKQAHEAAMGTPISPIVVNCSMEEFETMGINTTNHLPKLWLRYVDDNFVILRAEHSNHLLQHINMTDPHIQFTQKNPNVDGSLLFLDTLSLTEPRNHLAYFSLQKATNIDQSPHWNIHCNLSARYSVFNTITHKTRAVCAKSQLFTKEEEHIRDTLHSCRHSK